MAVLPGVLGWSAPATYRSGTPLNQHPAVARWHAHLRGLATAIHEISGLRAAALIKYSGRLVRNKLKAGN
ncbi:MAG: hypothetical protein V3R70_04885 [Syntrophobacteria bacterium]